MEDNGKYIRIKKIDGYLAAHMPDGTLIPVQDKLTFTNDSEQSNFVHVHFTCKIPVHLFTIEEPDESAQLR